MLPELLNSGVEWSPGVGYFLQAIRRNSTNGEKIINGVYNICCCIYPERGACGC